MKKLIAETIAKIWNSKSPDDPITTEMVLDQINSKKPWTIRDKDGNPITKGIQMPDDPGTNQP